MNDNLKMKKFYNTGLSKNPDFIKRQLLYLQYLIKGYESEIYQALKTDLCKSKSEAYLTELGMVYQELKYHLDHPLSNKRVKTPLSLQFGKSEVVREAYGHVLIIVPFNYPIQLGLIPLISAIACGNVVSLLLSDKLSATHHFYQKLFSHFSSSYLNYLGQDHRLIEKVKYDFIFFTGSKEVGRIIAKKAIEDDSEYCLELGGKSPCLVSEHSNLKLAAKKIVWGKLINAGQTCVAVDYVLVDKKISKEFIKLVQNERKKQKLSISNPDYPALVNQRALDRIQSLLKDQEFSETKTLNLKMSDLMKEEIFGPILPIIEYNSLNEALDYIKENDKPLAAYIFSNNSFEIDTFKEKISAGSIAVNDCVIQLANPNLPFGGVNSSGRGKYHHQYSSELFSHPKAVYTSYNPIDLPLRYQPFSNVKDWLIKQLL